jgi:hypothetical protein
MAHALPSPVNAGLRARISEDREGAEKSSFSLLPSVLALAALIQGFFSSQAIAFSVQFTLRCRCT